MLSTAFLLASPMVVGQAEATNVLDELSNNAITISARWAPKRHYSRPFLSLEEREMR